MQVYVRIYNIYMYMHVHVIMKTMRPFGYHRNGFVVTHALRHMTVHHIPKCMSCHKGIVVITGRAHCFHDYRHIMLILPSCFCEI